MQRGQQALPPHIINMGIRGGAGRHAGGHGGVPPYLVPPPQQPQQPHDQRSGWVMTHGGTIKHGGPNR
ncbi:hypothetical protein Y032_0978g3273 [Ancylostoma ceylanicum]|uniref:Uncharacterized protein n=1 Tax=Ancylostoma ceylanicum TaxID=53326 RepID=A0A016W858_9BILA|nr:hypothetical protein Y032_0978g3273 [Ancylostoma ceylanicum]